jgi:MFS family permease
MTTVPDRAGSSPAAGGEDEGAGQDGDAKRNGLLGGMLARITPPNPQQRAFALATLVTSVGTGLYMAGSIVFFVRILHLTAGFIGICLTVAALVGLLASIPAGRLADRRSPKHVMAALYCVEAVLFALFPLVRGRVAFLVIIAVITLAQSSIPPVRSVLLSGIVGKESRVEFSAYNRSALNVGMSIGALLAAGALAIGTEAAYNAVLLANALSFLIAGLLVARITVGPGAPRAATGRPAAVQAKGRHPLLEPRLVSAGTICGILYLSAAILDIGLPLQVAQHTSAPRWMIGFLLLINTVLAVLLQVRASKGANTVRGAARANRIAGLALLGACVVFPLASHRVAGLAIVLLICATLLLTAGELFSSAGSWGLSYGLIPTDDRQGEYLASFGMISSLVQAAGPVLAAFVVSGGLAAWLGLGVVFAVSGLISPLIAGQDLVGAKGRTDERRTAGSSHRGHSPHRGHRHGGPVPRRE